MIVYLIRHGEALSASADPARGLSREGVLQVEATARAATRRGVKPSVIFHSSKKRAKETAGILAGHLSPLSKCRMAEGLTPNNDPAIWAGRLQDMSEDIMLVGHLPHLPMLASILISGDEQGDSIPFQTATMAAIEKRADKSWKLMWTINHAKERL